MNQGKCIISCNYCSKMPVTLISSYKQVVNLERLNVCKLLSLKLQNKMTFLAGFFESLETSAFQR